MAWVRLDDHFDEHHKIADVGPLGLALWVAGLAYCNRNLTDGFIPWATARSLLTWQFLGPEDKNGKRKRFVIAGTSEMVGHDVDSDFVIELLVSAGLWEDREDGSYYIHDYDQYQPSRADVLAERDKHRVRQKRYRDSHRDAVTASVTNASSDGRVTDAPDPVPDPDPTYSLSTPPTPPILELDPEQKRLGLYLRHQVHRQVLKGESAPDVDWCEDLIRRGATQTDIDHAVQESLAVGALPYCRRILERRVKERELGNDPDAIPQRAPRITASGTYTGSDGKKRLAGGGGRSGSSGDFGDAPAGSIRADVDAGEAAEDPGTGAALGFSSGDRAG